MRNKTIIGVLSGLACLSLNFLRVHVSAFFGITNLYDKLPESAINIFMMMYVTDKENIMRMLVTLE